MAVAIDKCTARVRVRDAMEMMSKLVQSKKNKNKNKTHVYYI